MPDPYYSDDYVTLYHGDCREIAEWLDADVVVTDPPYGQGYISHGVAMTSHADRARGDYNGRHRPAKSIAGDATTEARDAALDSWGDRPAIVFGSLLIAPPRNAKHTAVYVKPLDAGSLSAFGTLRRDLEGIWFCGSRRPGWGDQVVSGRGLLPAHQRPPTVMRSSVFPTAARLAGTPSGVAARAGHPHAKPLDVLEELIGHCPPGTVADPFAGSGSTLVAAKRLGRRAVGVELEERYCEIAAKRLAQGVLDFGAVS